MTPSARVAPRLDVAVLCSRVGYDADNRIVSLHEPLHTVALGPDALGRLLAPEFALYIVLVADNAQGDFEFSVEVRTESNVIIRPGRIERHPVSFASQYYPFAPFEHVFLIRDLVFPAPGWYHFHAMNRHASLSEHPDAARPPKLRVVRAE